MRASGSAIEPFFSHSGSIGQFPACGAESAPSKDHYPAVVHSIADDSCRDDQRRCLGTLNGHERLINVPRDREELSAAMRPVTLHVPTIDAGVQIFFCDHASPWQRPTNAKRVRRSPGALSFGERSAAAARRR